MILIMKKIIALVILIQIALSVQAQKVPYEKLEELSKAISTLQFGANELSYNDGKTDYEISFPEENFKVYYSNLLADNSIYKKSGNREVLELTENIDLSAIISITIISSENSVAQIRMIFPFNSIKTQIFEEGKLIETKEVSSIDFFVKNEYRKLYAEMIELCHYLKKEKGSFDYDIDEVAKKWETALNRNTTVEFQNLLKNYSNTLYEEQALLEIQVIKNAELVEKNRLEAIRVEKIQRARETEEGITNIQKLFSYGNQSYRNYQYFGQADSLTNNLLVNYSFADFNAGKYTELKNLRPELKERYKWNKEYYEKRDKILAYDALVVNANNLSYKYTNKLKDDDNGTLLLKASLLALGGMATLAGAYSVIAKDDTFSKSQVSDLLKYGGAAFGIGLTWTILQSRSVNRTGRKASAAQKEADEMKTSIGPVIDKRKESLSGSPLINTN
jgi:hypothetical protein